MTFYNVLSIKLKHKPKIAPTQIGDPIFHSRT